MDALPLISIITVIFAMILISELIKLKKEVRVAVTGVESVVFRCKKIEEALSSNFSPSAVDNITISSKGFNSDIHASAEYRAHMIKVMTRKAVSSC